MLTDLLTAVLDWSPTDVCYANDGDKLVLSRSGQSVLLVAVRCPGSLIWYRRPVEAALQRVCQDAARLGVKHIAVSDGVMLYAADVTDDGLLDRAFVYLGSSEPQTELWWLAVEGLSRSPGEAYGAAPRLLPETATSSKARTYVVDGEFTHPRYRLPARCFAYAGDLGDPDSWKLPYLLVDGKVDAKRLPKAIQSIVSNYRGETVRSIPTPDLPEVLFKLARAAASLGKLPHQCNKPAPTYQRLADTLAELGRLTDVVEA
jgi:hypothetical protein